MNTVAVLFLLTAVPAPEASPPVGRWTIEFANGVVEVCEVRQEGTVTVAEPLRSSPGRVAAREGGFILTFDDDRVERWRPVGRRMVVEHWFPTAQFPGGVPVVGIARRVGH